MAIQFELYKSPNPKDEEDKELYHARVVNFQHIDTDYLAKEIQQATSLTEGDVKAVLESLSHFMGSRLREGERVHLDGIGYFQVKLNSLEPITSPKLKANQMKLKANIGFKALEMTTIASFIGGIFSCLVLATVAPQLAHFALDFSAPEYFSLGIFGLTIVATLSEGALLKGCIAALLGMLISMIGMDPLSGNLRMTFDSPDLINGV